MEKQIIVFGSWFDSDDAVRVDYNSIRTLEATSHAELRLKVRGVLLAQLDELVSSVVGNFRTVFITKAGQRVTENELQFINSIPPGYGAVSQAGWRPTHGCWEDQVMYFVPAGSTLPGGKKLKEGERIQLTYNSYCPGAEEERLKKFFEDKSNLIGWIKPPDYNDPEEGSEADS